MFLRHIKNLFFLYSSKVFSSLSGFIAQIVIARQLIKEDYGIVSFYIILINIISTIVGFGLGNFWLRRFAVEGDNAIRWINPTIKTIMLLSLIMLPVYILIPYFTLGPNSLIISITLLPLGLHQAIVSIATATFQIQNKFKKLSFYLTIQNFSLLAASLTLFIFPFNIFIVSYGLISIFILTYSIKILVDFNRELSEKVTDNTASYRIAKVKDVFKSAWSFGIQGILYMFYYQSDILIITILLGAIFTGQYNAAYTVISLFFVFPSILFQVYLLPKSNIWIANRNYTKIKFVRNKVTLISFFIGIGAALVLYLVSEFLITFLYGTKFLDSVLLFKILVFTIPLKFASTSLGVLFVSEKSVSYKVYIQGMGAILNVILNFILISKVGILGAALSTVFTELVVAILMYLSSKRIFQKEV